MKYRTFQFTVTLQGRGENVDDAWNDAVTAFEMEPGTPDSYNEIEDEDANDDNV